MSEMLYWIAFDCLGVSKVAGECIGDLVLY